MKKRDLSLENEQETDYRRGENHCLIIAIDNYENDIENLDNCVKDAEDLKKILLEKYQFEESNLTTLFNSDATRKNILTLLREYKAKLKFNDNLLLTFSGHGANIDNTGYWIPFEAGVNEDYNYISTNDLIDRLDLIDCHHILLIIDACFSGNIFTKTRSSNIRGDEKRRSRAGLSASHSREIAHDGATGENSPFAKHLITKLKRNNKPLGISDLANYVIEKVQEDTKFSQTPIFRPLNIKGDDLGQFIFYPKHLYYQFDNVISYLAENKIDYALAELDNFCLESIVLPNEYE